MIRYAALCIAAVLLAPFASGAEGEPPRSLSVPISGTRPWVANVMTFAPYWLTLPAGGSAARAKLNLVLSLERGRGVYDVRLISTTLGEHYLLGQVRGVRVSKGRDAQVALVGLLKSPASAPTVYPYLRVEIERREGSAALESSGWLFVDPAEESR